MENIINLDKILQSHISWLSNSGGVKANLSGVNLNGVNLKGANLQWANLSEADLSNANLSEANLSGANLSGVNFIGANLSKADLNWANISRSNLSKANFEWTDLSGANLSEADFSETKLNGANLIGANLSKADLSEAYLDEIKKDFFDKIQKVPSKIPALRQALVEGHINCTAELGIANSNSIIERWFLQIRPGHTPETSQACAITVAWIDSLELKL